MPLLFSAALEFKVDQILSAFENGTTEVQYCYIENIHDGRGYTAGKAGFTSATGDLYEFVKRYRGALEKYLPELKRIADAESSETSGLRGFVKDYRSECKGKAFELAQDSLVDDMYKKPAREYLKKLHLKTPLAYLIIYDTIIQHGDGDDPDSLSGILGRMKPSEDEMSFLYSFLEEREQVLLHATDPATRVEWKKSVDRVYALRSLLDQKNFDLNDVTIKVWGETFPIRSSEF
ncbi:MAG: chitosanase [Bacteriovoracaceae bacterium]